jgi:hypothetical protein
MDIEATRRLAIENLCYNDERSPYYDAAWVEDAVPGKNCSCDKCFKGSHKLAETIIGLLDLLEKK